MHNQQIVYNCAMFWFGTGFTRKMLSIQSHSENHLLNGAIANMKLTFFMSRHGKIALLVVLINIHVILMEIKKCTDSAKYQGLWYWMANSQTCKNGITLCKRFRYFYVLINWTNFNKSKKKTYCSCLILYLHCWVYECLCSKLITYFYHRGPVQCYYRDVLIANNSFVDSHLKSLGSKSIQVMCYEVGLKGSNLLLG